MVASVIMAGFFIGEDRRLCELGSFVGNPACQVGYSETIMEQCFRASIFLLIRYFGFTNFLVFPYNQTLRGRTLDRGVSIGATVWTSYSWGYVRDLTSLWINCEEGNTPTSTCLSNRWETLSILTGFIANLISLTAVLTTIAGTFSSRTK
ncbi:unnamed protein product, partial [Chrysoparadoxa australica]